MKKSKFLALLMAVALTTAPVSALAEGTTPPPTTTPEEDTTTPPNACEPQGDEDDDSEEDDGEEEDEGDTTTPQLSHNSYNKGKSSKGKGHDKDHWGDKGHHGKDDDDDDEDEDEDDSTCGSDDVDGKKKGWSKVIINILKHLENEKMLGGLIEKLEKLLAWAKSVNGSQSDRDALGAVEEALKAKEDVGEAEPEDLIILAETQDKMSNTDAAVATLERALELDYNNEEVYSELSKKHVKKGDKGVKVYVKGHKPAFDVKPVVKNGRTLVPVRAIGDVLEAEVLWEQKTSTVTLINPDGKKVVLKLNNNTAVVDGKQVKLDVPAQAIDGRTMVPLRALGDFFGLTVGWDQTSQMATLK